MIKGLHQIAVTAVNICCTIFRNIEIKDFNFFISFNPFRYILIKYPPNITPNTRIKTIRIIVTAFFFFFMLQYPLYYYYIIKLIRIKAQN